MSLLELDGHKKDYLSKLEYFLVLPDIATVTGAYWCDVMWNEFLVMRL